MRRNFYYVREVAALLGTTTQLVTRMIHNEQIVASRLDKGRWRVTVKNLRDFAQQNNIELNWDALTEPGGQVNSPPHPSPRPYVPETPESVVELVA